MARGQAEPKCTFTTFIVCLVGFSRLTASDAIHIKHLHDDDDCVFYNGAPIQLDVVAIYRHISNEQRADFMHSAR